MFYLVSYDIVDDKRRVKLSKTLKDFGDRIQLSVFECLLTDDLAMRMVERIEDIIDNEKDSVRIYRLCGKCEKQIDIFGLGEVSKIEDVYIF